MSTVHKPLPIDQPLPHGRDPAISLRYDAGLAGLFLAREIAAVAWEREATVRAVARGVAHIAMRLPLKRRTLADANIARAFPDLDAAARATCVESSLANTIRTLLELALLDHADVEALGLTLRVSGEDYLWAARGAGRGVLLASGHVGPYPLMIAALSRMLALPLMCVVRHPKDARVAARMQAIRDRHGMATIAVRPAAGSVRACVDWLSAGGVVFTMIDNRGSAGTPDVDFFGSACRTFLGPAAIARQAGAAIVPCFARRGAGRVLEIAFGNPVDRCIAHAATRASDIAVMQTLTRRLEDEIRRDPTAYFWLHDRWRR